MFFFNFRAKGAAIVGRWVLIDPFFNRLALNEEYFMRSRILFKKSIFVLMLLAAFALIGYGCDSSQTPTTPTTPTDSNSSAGLIEPTQTGEFTKCTYTENLGDSGYSSAIVYYPCETEAGPFPASTLTGGWTNEKEEMDWLGSHVVTHGYVVIAMTPVNKMGMNPQWRNAHNAGIAKLKSESNRSGSPIAGLVRTDALQIMGYSKGGGGTLLAAHDQGAGLKTAQAIAPYMDTVNNISNIKASTIIYTGTDDAVAPPFQSLAMFSSLPKSINRTLAYFNGFGHMVWWNKGDPTAHERALTYIVSWMKVHLNGDSRYEAYLDGTQDWFYRFEHYDAGERGGTLPR